ncbi:FAD-dependent oxidoreductase [Weeksellaceae bacterium TAE3-ERU29]|nr:FAD-dependent oxidoreductase [Weeksellaceae bacterium TAE3-ERU29]
MVKKHTIAIVGGGVSGATTAIRLGELGISTILLEKKESLVNGPPFCHLHAGGNLYPDISDDQCLKLMEQSIEMAKLYPNSIDRRPTFIAIPKGEEYEPKNLIKRLDKLVKHYKSLISKDSTNEVLGAPDKYYQLFEKETLDKLSEEKSLKHPVTPEEWMTKVTKIVDFTQLKFPVILVSEYGWNLFRLAAQAQLALNKIKDCKVLLETEVKEVIDKSKEETDYNWEIKTNKGAFYADYLVNASGFKTGELDNDLDINEERMVEFKAAYVAKWEKEEGDLPELIFHGERGTPHGMAQLTPYCNNNYQIHGMTEDITLFKDGLVKSEEEDAQPRLKEKFEKKIEKGWSKKEIKERTQNAIDFIVQYVPSFKTAKVGGPPLFGAQQIPGEDASLRVAEVSFPSKFYARSEIVKASSALDVADKIVERLKKEKILEKDFNTGRNFKVLNSISVKKIDEAAVSLAEERGYPKDMGYLLVSKKREK